MATRDAILRELKLAPAWRLKSRDAAVAQVVAPAAEPSRAAVLAEPGAAFAVEDPDGRRARIAALDWADFDADVEACRACGLCKTRKRSVPGVGDRNAGWMFVGEGPGQVATACSYSTASKTFWPATYFWHNGGDIWTWGQLHQGRDQKHDGQLQWRRP